MSGVAHDSGGLFLPLLSEGVRKSLFSSSFVQTLVGGKGRL